MTNIRKQTIVISVLIVLIACAGLFARNFNERLTDNALSTQASETLKTSSFFADSRIDKESRFDKGLAELKELQGNKSLSGNVRAEASRRLFSMVSNNTIEGKIETQIKGRGFADALCMITGKHAEVFVKSPKELTSKQVNEITKIITNNASISPSNIFIKAQE